jgi:2,4-diaminopentanoate dehydrogenase
VFGAQLLAQFIQIASATCPDRDVKSQHAATIAAGTLAAGSVAAQRITISGIRGGHAVLQFRATWYCTIDPDPAWEVRETGWHVSVDGDAPLQITLRMPIPLDRMADISPAYTANRAANAVPYVCAAAPGIHSTLDLPRLVATLG